MFTIGPYNSIFFGYYGMALRNLQTNYTGTNRIDEDDPRWTINVFIAGTWAGVVQAIVFCPVEVVKTTLQANVSSRGGWTGKKIVKFNGPFDCLKKIYDAGGIKMIFRGLHPLLWR